MSKTIEIKGKTYDAVTGQLVVDAVKPSERKTASAVKAPTAAAGKTAAKHRPKPSSTLLRTAVSKPTRRRVAVQSELSTPGTPHVITVSKSVQKVDQDRLARAKSVPAHAAVRRFSTPEPRPTLESVIRPVAVHTAPASAISAASPVQATPPNSNLFMEAIARSNHHVDIKAHSSHLHRKARRHYSGMVAGASALFVLALFGWYLNSPGLQLRVAGLQAGVSTVTPDFQKAGFAFGAVRADNGRRVITLTNGTKNARYHLTEQTTNWDGSTMINHVSSVAADGTPNYTTLQSDSQTIYRFGTSQATWVKNGVWYNLSGDQPIDDGQLQALVYNS